jgi:SAM-dependent methyltransferase
MSSSQDKLISKFDLNGGELAHLYASLPYGYYKEEIYPIFCELLDAMGDDIRVLDVGAGPGNFALEFYKQRPHSKIRFTLMDSSRVLLSIAAERLAQIGFQTEIFCRNYNVEHWEENLGKFDAIVSNNSLFSLNPVFVGQFYVKAYELLNADGVILNQQAFSPAKLKEDFKAFYSVLGPERYMSEKDKLREVEIAEALAEIDSDERLKFSAEIACLTNEGWRLEETPSYASLNLSTNDHVELMNSAKFNSACIWQKMHFAVLAGLKGKPFPI